MRFSVVVPTYNRNASLSALIDALAAQDLPRDQFEIIVVDDGSAVAVGPLPNVRLIRQENRGSGTARMRGVAEARGTYIAFTDDDCRPAPDWLSRLAAALDRHPEAAIAGPTINALAENPYSSMTQSIVTHLTKAGDFAPTSNLTFPRARLLELAGFDPEWKLAAGEDRELCAQWTGGGGEIVFDPDVRVMHHHPLTLAQFIRQHFAYGRGACMVRQKRLPIKPFGHVDFLRERVLTDRRAAVAMLCFLIAQAATVAGFARERLARALS